MIEILCYNGQKQLVNPAAIARVIEAGASSQWHGIKCFVKLFDGTSIECVETLQQVQDKIEQAEQKS